MILGPPTWASGSWANTWATGSWSVTGTTGTTVSILIAGVEARTRVRKGSMTIRDLLNEAPNTCAFTVGGTAPSAGQSLRVVVNSVLLFNGTLQTVDLSYEGKPTQPVWTCHAIDDTARVNRRRPFGTWTLVSATTIAQYMITTYASGFTSTNVQAALPVVTITFDGSEDFSTCLSRLATMVGGYWYVSDLDLHFFQTEAAGTPDPIQTGYAFADDPPVVAETDLSQVRTRVYGKGHGEATTTDVLSAETVIPLADTVMFNPAGGKAIAGTTPDGAQSQILTYTGVQSGGVGSTVGPSVSPSVSPSLTIAVGSGVETGSHQYGYTYVTASGESLLSPLSTIVVAAITSPVNIGAVSQETSGFAGGITSGATYSFKYTFKRTADSVETAPSPASGNLVSNGFYARVLLSGCDTPPTGWTRQWYRTAGNGATWKLNPPSGGSDIESGLYFFSSCPDASLGATPPASNPVLQQVTIAGVALGPSGTTQRKIYRTVAAGSQLKLQQTIANNTATSGVVDSTPDASLGANAPISNTSGLASGGAVGGGFYTVASVVFSTNGAATSANTASPVFTSASYTFVAADVGAWVYIKSGTNWTTGFYNIVSVAAGAATLAGACATVASPTAATWGVDYSSFTVPRVTFTDLVIDATTSTKFTSAAFPVGVNYIGNVLSVANSVGFSEQRVIVLSVSGTVATCDKVLGALSSTAGRGVLGVAPVAPYVFAGSTTLITASAAPFSTTGGWISIGQQLVRYTGVSGNSLTGIPTSGSGALIDTVGFGEHINILQALTGVTGVALAMQKGTPVHIWVQRDDFSAQTTMAAIDGGTGVYEYLISDERRGEASLIARCDADLAQFSRPLVTVTYATRDMKTKSGKTIVVNLASPAISKTLTIQDVTITEIDIAPNLAPKFAVTASSLRFSLEDLLRRLAA